MGLRVYDSEDERREVRKWRRKELEEERDYYNAYYFGYANLPTCKEVRHLRYMQYRDWILAQKKDYHIRNRDWILAYKKRHYEINKDRILAYKKRQYQMKKKENYFMQRGFLNKHVKIHKCLE